MQTIGNSQPDAQTIWHPLTQHKPLRENPPAHIVEADGCYLKARDGTTYLDAVAGIWCVNIGHGRKEVAAVASEQMERLAFLTPTMTHDPGVKLTSKLLDMVGMQGRVYLSNSGSEANEAAFKIIWQYHAQSGEPGGYQRHKIISRYRAYHGNTLGALSATGQAERKVGYGVGVPGFVHIPPPYPYRAGDGLIPAEHGLQCAQILEDTIVYEGPQTVAAFIMEPIISGGGVLIPPDEYLPKVRAVCDKYGVLLILDEVVSGFGRTGKMFAYQHWNVKPDIFTFAKGIASGYVPLGATLVRQEIFDAFLSEPGDLAHFRHINTYGAHPVAAAVALKNIEILENEELVENSEKQGAYLLRQLDELTEHPCVGDVRGRGLLAGVELVSDKGSKAPLAGDKVGAVINGCKQQGVLLGRNGNTVPGLSNVVITAPPLIAGEAEIDRIVNALKTALIDIL
jgi:adenosylmethionine-8-amino-7-oxononanoate aminotransferase